MTMLRGLLLVALAAGPPPALAAGEDVVATFSIVARDAETGALGCAVASRYFAVGAVVPWAEADVGAIATQASVNVGYGPRGLELLRSGLSADEVLKRLLAEDAFPAKESRQVAIVDAQGRVAVHTGPETVHWAGHRRGPGYSAQGNILAGPGVVDAMAEAYETTAGSLAQRLLAALEAGDAAGGDRRGRQSAALLVVQTGGGRNIDNDVVVRLQADDHETPIRELRRLLHIQLALRVMGESRRLMRAEQPAAALAAAERAVALWPAASDTHLNLGLLAYRAGDRERAMAALREGKRRNPEFQAQLEDALDWTGHPGLDDRFLKELFPEPR